MSDADNAPPLFAPFAWNFLLELNAVGTILLNNFVGGYGLWFLNDNGEMMAKCYEMVNWKLLPVWDEAPSA
jgi:hypothetical protein